MASCMVRWQENKYKSSSFVETARKQLKCPDIAKYCYFTDMNLQPIVVSATTEEQVGAW